MSEFSRCLVDEQAYLELASRVYAWTDTDDRMLNGTFTQAAAVWNDRVFNLHTWIQRSNRYSSYYSLQIVGIIIPWEARTLHLSDFVGGKYRGEVKNGVFGS